MRERLERIVARLRQHRTATIVGFSILGGIVAAYVMPLLVNWTPYDYSIYVQGARMMRAGQDPHALLPYWYPLPIVLFTTLPWSFLPDRFGWAFAFIPLGLLHLRFGRRAILWWLFFPLLINVAYAQAEGWLILPLTWILEDAPVKSSFGMMALLFKPAYGMLLAPYRIWGWLCARRWENLAWLLGLAAVAAGAAFAVDPQWEWHWLNGVLHRSENPELIQRNMTVWAFADRGAAWLVVLAVLLVALAALTVVMFRSSELRGDVLLALSIFFFPGGLNPVSSMMVIPLAQTSGEILTLVVVSWLVAGLDVAVGGFGGMYLLIVLVALALRWRRYRLSRTTLSFRAERPWHRPPGQVEISLPR